FSYPSEKQDDARDFAQAWRLQPPCPRFFRTPIRRWWDGRLARLFGHDGQDARPTRVKTNPKPRLNLILPSSRLCVFVVWNSFSSVFEKISPKYGNTSLTLSLNCNNLL